MLRGVPGLAVLLEQQPWEPRAAPLAQFSLSVLPL
jgi:hypothetical protein